MTEEQVEAPDEIRSGRLVMNGDFIFMLPINGVSGKTHSLGCTVCREEQLTSGRHPGGPVGNIAFSVSEKHGRMIAKRHSDYHLVTHKRIVHVVIARDLPKSKTPRNRKTR